MSLDRSGPLPAVGEPIVDQSGRVLGPRALSTRQRLLEAGRTLLADRKSRDVTVVDIAREIGAAPATFYQYFKDVDDLVLCLAEQAAADMPAVVGLIEKPWSEDEGLARAREIVEAFIRHWDANQAVLRIRNLASDEGDGRFQGVRARTLGPVLRALAGRIAAARERGDVSSEIHPEAAAAALSAILERLAAYHTELSAMGVSREDLVRTSARILHTTLTGRS